MPEKKIIPTFIIQGIVLLIFMKTADFLVLSRPWGLVYFWGIMDNIFHNIIALIVLLPLYIFCPRLGLLPVIAGGIICSSLDIDHFIAVRSFSLAQVYLNPCRPWTHSLTFTLICMGGAWIYRKRILDITVVGAALASHVIRDAGMGGCSPLLFPLPLRSIPEPLYLILVIIIGWSAGLVGLYLGKARGKENLI
ncbi:MAG: hypothetical protein ABIA63_12845 [bacterium]